jgi:hypothetical protein
MERAPAPTPAGLRVGARPAATFRSGRRASLRRALSGAIAVLAAPVACGPSASSELQAAVTAAAAPVVAAFEADLDAGRPEEALRRATVAFQAAAPADSVRQVTRQLRESLGARERSEVFAVEDVAVAGDPPLPRTAVLVYEAAFERGGAQIRARVERDAVRDVWLLDGYEVRSELFTWTLRR